MSNKSISNQCFLQTVCETKNIVGKTNQNDVLIVKFVPNILQQPLSLKRYVRVKQSSKEIVLTVTANDDTEDEYACNVFVYDHAVITPQKATLRVMRKPTVNAEPGRRAKTASDSLVQVTIKLLSNRKVTWTKDNYNEFSTRRKTSQ
jgi:hypothetical protein